MAYKHVEWQLAAVNDCEEIAEGVQRIVLAPERPVPARPGEHVDVAVRLADGREDVRSYSIAGASATGDRLALSLFRSPTSRGGSAFMHALRPGTRIRITLPMHDFPLRIGAAGDVLLAGGFGITAVRGMASLLKRLGADYTLHYVGHSRARMPYLDPLEAAHGDRLVAHITEESGRMSVERLVAAVPENAELYMCGPIRLM